VSFLRQLSHEYEVIHALLVDTDKTTAQTRLTPEDFVESGIVFKVLQEMESSLSPRTVTGLVVRLKRCGEHDRRLIRRILSTDPTLALTHFDWACSEVKEWSKELREYQEALRVVGRFKEIR
jgi:hypothetical protein